jgi:hypothetical protein
MPSPPAPLPILPIAGEGRNLVRRVRVVKPLVDKIPLSRCRDSPNGRGELSAPRSSSVAPVELPFQGR